VRYEVYKPDPGGNPAFSYQVAAFDEKAEAEEYALARSYIVKDTLRFVKEGVVRIHRESISISGESLAVLLRDYYELEPPSGQHELDLEMRVIFEPLDDPDQVRPVIDQIHSYYHQHRKEIT
jgi:hypothetical protein